MLFSCFMNVLMKSFQPVVFYAPCSNIDNARDSDNDDVEKAVRESFSTFVFNDVLWAHESE